MPRHALIAGLGLIGGSAGIALRSRGWRVSYVDPYVHKDVASRYGFEDDADNPDVTLIATPLDAAFAYLGGDGVLTSACSVMAPLRARAGANFIAGHPLAGSEQSGLAAARADVFEGKQWFLDARNDVVEELVRDCGAIADFVSAEEHDAALAVTSHLPQMLSTALAASIDPELLRFAGPGLRTFLRLAGSDASVWAPILEANRDRIAPHAEAVARIVREMLDDPTSAFARANELAKRL
jgi:prephenate dehydrogenase